MADLFNQQISATYSGLLKTTSSGVLTSSLTQITDGRGNGSPLYISTAAINFYNAYTFPSTDGLADQVLSTNAGGVLSWVDVGSGDVSVSGTPNANQVAIWTDATTIKGDPTLTIDDDHKITLYQPNSADPIVVTNSYNIGGGNIANVSGTENLGFGIDNLNSVTTGNSNIAFGTDALLLLTTGSSNLAIGNKALRYRTAGGSNIGIGTEVLDGQAGGLTNTGSNNLAIGNGSQSFCRTGNTNISIGTASLKSNLSGEDNTAIGVFAGYISTGNRNLFLGRDAGKEVETGDYNVVIGSASGDTIDGLSNRIIISDGQGYVRQTFDNSGIATFLGSATNNVNSRYSVIISDNSAVAAGNGGGIIFRGKYTGTTLIDGGGINLYKENSTDGEYGYGLNFTTRENSGNLTTRLTLAPTGAATFSSSVTATSFSSTGQISTGNGADADILINVTSVGATNKYAFLQSSVSARALALNPTNGGNVLIGTTTDAGYKLDVNGTSRFSGNLTIAGSTSTAFADIRQIGFINSANSGNIKASIVAINGADSDDMSLSFRTSTSAANISEKLKIAGNGAATFSNTVNAGTSAWPNGSINLFHNYGGVDAIGVSHANGAASGSTLAAFAYSGAVIGSITQSGTTGVSYNTSSDYRLKENVTPITNALSRVSQLKPSRFNFISEADKTVDGFLAHEVQEIIPEAISGEKDALNEDGTPNYQGIDQSKIVPLLVAAIQEQQTIIEDLKARIEKLEV